VGKFDYGKIHDLLHELSVDTPTHNIKYSLYPINNKSVYEENGSKLVMVKVNVDVGIKTTGEGITFPMDLIKLPHYGETGFIINGKNRQIIDLYTLSYGWYVMRTSPDFKEKAHLKLNSEIGKNLLVYEKDYVLYITTGKKMSEPAVPLAVFLKAFTGSNYKELASRLGNDNPYVASSFSKEEPLKAECVDIVMTTLFEEFRGDKRVVEFNNMGIEDRYWYAYSKLFSPRHMILGEAAGVRMKRALSFKERCRNLMLAEDLTVAGKTYLANTVLDSKILEEIDYSPVDKLKVFNATRNLFTVRKDSVFNFRALGYTLEEDLEVNGNVIPKGTVLTVDDLRVIGESSLPSLQVSKDSQRLTVTRRVYSGSLAVDDIISMTQVYIDTLSGLDCFDNIYDLTNQNLITVQNKSLSLIRSYCKSVNYYIDSYMQNTEEDSDLLKKIISLSGFDTGILMEEISSVESKESQQAELNNTIQKVSKEHRVSKDVKRSSTGMVGVQESQFGRLDPVESPESDKIGVVHTKSWLSKTDDSGFLCAPFVRVVNGKVVSGKVEYLTAAQQEDQFIAEWNETFHQVDDAGNMVLKDKVTALCNSTFMPVSVKDVSYMEYSPYQTMSPARMQIPLQEHSNPKRILMGSNHQKQSINPIKSERSYVSSGGDSLLDEGVITATQILEEYYDANLSAVSDTPKGWFLNSTLVLKDIEHNKGYKDLFFTIEGQDRHFPVITIPFVQKASSGGLFSYKVNTSTDCRYKGDEVVAHSSDVDIRKYDLHLHTDFGHMIIDTKKFERAIAIGKNLLVGFKTYESSTIDDAVLINADLVSLNTLTTVDLHKISYKLSDEMSEDSKGIKEHEEFGFLGRSKEPHMTDEGLPKKDSFLKPGDTVIGVKRIKTEFTRHNGTQVLNSFDKSKRLEGTAEGQVVSAYIEGNEAIVVLATLKPIEEGDKLAGRFGNKGVVARIVPAHLMPFDPVTGMILDICLNPQGVPSRSNVSQILELTLGMSMKKLGKIAIVSPYKGDTLEFVKEMADKTNTKPIMMRDGRSGQWFERPINVGIMYMLKLEHMVSHKIRGIGLSNKTDPVFNQPTKGAGHAGGQAFGEYESWCLMGVGANKVLQDLTSVQSDDLPAIENLKEAFEEDLGNIEVEGNNNNDHLFQVLMRSMCVEANYSEEEGFGFKPLTDEIIMGLNHKPIDINNKDSIRSTDIFGVTTNDRIKFENRTTWSWIPLNCEMVHPFWIVKGKINRYIIAGKYRGNDENGKIIKEVLKIEMVRDLIACKCYIEEVTDEGGRVFVFRYGGVEGKMTGMPALVHLLKNTSLSEAREYYEASIKRAKKDSIILENKVILRGLLDFEEAGLTLADFVVTTLPVMPLSFRPPSMFRNSFQDFDFYYRRVIDEIVKFRSGSKTNPRDIYSIYLRIVELCGLTYGKEVRTTKAYKPILKYFSGREGSNKKHGRIRENLLKKRVMFSGRTVIVPFSNTKRLPTEIGIPFLMCVDIWRPQLVSLLHKTLSHYKLGRDRWDSVLDVMGSNMTRFRQLISGITEAAGKSYIEVYDEIYAVISAYVEGRKNEKTGEWEVAPRVALAGRQPSLHKFNIRAYTPFITHHKCIEIHPLICKGYNADFDGDQMWVVGLVNESACIEALEKLSPKYGVINPKDSSVVLDPAQDIRLGVYYATMLHKNVESISLDDRYKDIKFYSNTEQLSTDVDLAFVNIHDLVCLNLNGKRYLSTAGRILFNALLPHRLGFTDEPYSNVLGLDGIDTKLYLDLRFDGLVSGSGGSRKTPKYVKMSDVTSWSYNNLTPDENILVFQGISEFGFRHADMSGISLYLDDFIQPENMDQKIKEANKYADIVNRRYYQGAISDKVRKDTLIAIYDGCKSVIKDTFMTSFDRNNNIFIMFDSGARGSEGQIMQACGVIGVLQKAKGEVLEIPVLSNYTKGNTSFETLLLSFSTRTGVASTQNETATSGELTRMAVYMSSGFKIVEDNCGVEYEDFKVDYGDFTGKVRTPSGAVVKYAPGQKMDAKTLLNKVLSSDDTSNAKLLRNFLTINGELTDTCLSIMVENKVKSVTCEDGTYRLYYKIDTLSKSLLMRRTAIDLPHLASFGYNPEYVRFISAKTLEHIEAENTETVKVRTMLNCNSVGGVCSCCFGVRYDINTMPDVGAYIGIESAQSIGEPAAQLVLSLFHQGGVAGASIDAGVDLLNSLLKKGDSEKLKAADLPPTNGYLTYNSVDANNYARLLTDSGEEITLALSGEPIVRSGEYVKYDTPLTTGFIVPRDVLSSPVKEEIRFRQLSLLELYFRTFELSDIKVNARHFEIFVKLQTSLVSVLNSDDPEFKDGAQYELNDVVQNGTGKIDYLFDVSNNRSVISHFGGMETYLAHERVADRLGRIVTDQKKSKGSSLIGKIFYGQYVTDDRTKLLTTTMRVKSVKPAQVQNQSNLKELEDQLLSEIVQVQRNEDIKLDVDLESLLLFSPSKPLIEEEIIYDNVKEEKEETTQPKTKELDKMKLF
jgi:DNA-directed RNA polymerase subunit beta